MARKHKYLFPDVVANDPRCTNPLIPEHLKGAIRSLVDLVKMSHETNQFDQAMKLEQLLQKKYQQLLEDNERI